MDVGSPELLLKVWEILKKGGVPLGLELNSKKCEWSWLNPDCNLVCPIDGVPITPTSEIQILGVPLGSQEFTESFVKRDLLDVAEGVMSKLIDFEDTQAAIFLLLVVWDRTSDSFYENHSAFPLVQASW